MGKVLNKGSVQEFRNHSFIGFIHKKVGPLKIWVVLANRQGIQIAVNH
jgi:hypothetical protein